MHLYLLQDASGEIIAAHPDKEVIRLHFYSSQKSLEIWIMETSDTTGIVESYRMLVSKGNFIMQP
jgi:hypothetical protein